MDRQQDKVTDPEMEGIPTDYDQLEVSESGLDQGDIRLIRDKLELTPTERLMAAQDFMNTALRIRAQNGDRAKVCRSCGSYLRKSAAWPVWIIPASWPFTIWAKPMMDSALSSPRLLTEET